MTRIRYTLFLLFVSLQLAAQMPDWYLPTSRKIHYPQDIWSIGFVEGELQEGETIEQAEYRLKISATEELLSTISISIEYEIQSSVNNELHQSSLYFDEQIRELFSSETRFKSNIQDLSGLKVEIYRNIKDGTLAAFAYVNKLEACKLYINQIRSKNEEIKTTLTIINYLIQNKESFKASEELNTIKELIKQSKTNYKWLVLLGCNEEELSILLSQYTDLYHKIEQLSTFLSSNTTYIYIQCNGTIFDWPCSMIVNKIKSSLSEVSCSFTEDPSLADWTITITTNATSRMNSNEHFVNVSISGTIFCVSKHTTYNIYKEEHDSAVTDIRAAEIILNRGNLLSSVINEIYNILSSK